MAATDQVVCSDVKFGQLDANGQIRSRTISLQVPPLYEEFLAVIQQHLPNGQKIRETTRTTREIVADVRLSDGRVVHHDNHSIFRAEIQKNTSSGGRIPFSFKVALEFEENVDPPAPLKFAITCAGISACAPSWDQRHRAKAPLQLNVCCEMVASYCSPAAEELLRDENLGAGPLALELVQTAVAIEVSTRNNALANGFDAWLEPAEVTDEKAFQSLHAWMNATERLRAEHFLMFSGSFKGTNLQMFFVPFTALETGSSKLRLGVFMKPAVEVVEGRTFWTKYTTGAREAAAALQHMTDKAKTLIKNGKLPVAFDLDGVLISSDRDDTNTFRARPKAKQELNKLKEAGCLLGICSSACQGHVDKQRADHFHGVFDDARCVGIDVLVSDDRKKTFETVFPEYGDLCIGVDDRAVTSDTDWDKAQVDRVITIGNYHFRTCPPEAAFFEFETVAQLILTIKGEFLKQFDPCGGCWVADPASPKHFRPLKVVVSDEFKTMQVHQTRKMIHNYGLKAGECRVLRAMSSKGNSLAGSTAGSPTGSRRGSPSPPPTGREMSPPPNRSQSPAGGKSPAPAGNSHSNSPSNTSGGVGHKRTSASPPIDNRGGKRQSSLSAISESAISLSPPPAQTRLRSNLPANNYTITLFVDTNVLYYAGAPDTNKWGKNIANDPGLGRTNLPSGQNFWRCLLEGNARIFITKDVAGEVDRAKDNTKDKEKQELAQSWLQVAKGFPSHFLVQQNVDERQAQETRYGQAAEVMRLDGTPKTDFFLVMAAKAAKEGKEGQVAVLSRDGSLAQQYNREGVEILHDRKLMLAVMDPQNWSKDICQILFPEV